MRLHSGQRIEIVSLGCSATGGANSVIYANPARLSVNAYLHHAHGSESINSEQVVLRPVIIPDQRPVRRQPPFPVDLEFDLVFALRQSVTHLKIAQT